MRLDWREDTGTGTAVLVRERHPMHSLAVPRFVGSLDGRVRYQSEPDPERPDDVPRPRRLKALPRPAYPTSAQVVLRLGNGGQGLDSGRPDTVWHRLYLEGCIPPGCHLRVDARAFNDPAEATELPFVPQPPLLWNPLGSELPFQSGLLPSRPRDSGLFETLLQADSGAIRRLSGRYLQLRLRADSEGFRTPAIHAIRVYHPRFSYQEAYLPEHFRQGSVDTDPIPGDDDAASGADVRERLLALFEGVLTPIEGRIAAAETLLHPDAAPEEQLDVLARSLGLELPAYWPEQRRRRFLREGCFLQQWRGTLRGICLALDIVTDGAVRRGQIVPVENFRLRRTMATILGVDMDDRDHPLTLGTGMSGNSIVGDSLILSEEDARSFLALFAPELANARESSEVQAFFDRYSHQVTVLLHGQARHHRKVVLAALEAQMPAHVQWRLIETDQPFVLGLAPLLGVDTYVETAPASRPVVLDDTYLGREGLLSNPTAFSPRAVNARAAGT
jgi:phage tail-like protein